MTTYSLLHQSRGVPPLYQRWRLLLQSLFVLVSLSTVSAVSASNEDSDLPPLLDSDDIAFFFERNELDELHGFLQQVFERSARNPLNGNPQNLPQTLVSRGGGDTYTTQYKLECDLEQAHYLATHATTQTEQEYFQKTVIPIYESVLQNIPPLSELNKTRGLYAFRDQDYKAGIASVYNKALYHTDYDTLRDARGNKLPLLNPNLPDISTQYNKDGIVVVDDILSQPALQRIQELLLTSTVWYQTKTPLEFGKYVGAYIDDGLYDRILLELAMELSQTFSIFNGHPLKYLWAYKYDSDHASGINLHADEAAVNVNIWLTPDSANLDPNSGGLVVFTAKPPNDWNFQEYNTNTDFVREHLLKPTNYANVTVPHAQNRAVIFDSALFHQTDKYKFQRGYENRRINLTLLYGSMQKAETTSHNDGSNGDGDQNGEL